jgi:hypothetical protein
VAELSDEKWLYDLAFLCDISHHVHDLNTKLQGQKLISDMSGAVRAFEMKLKLFWKQLENINLCHFSFCKLLYRDGSESVPFPSIPVVGVIDFLAENFKMSFSDFRTHAKNVPMFENPFSVEVNDASEKFQLGLIELQYCSILRSLVVSTRMLYAFYQYLGSLKLRKLAWNLASVFSSTYRGNPGEIVTLREK